MEQLAALLSRRCWRNLGGRLEGFYFAFGDNDAYVISEGPDNATAAAISLAITTGAIRTKTIVLLTPEEVDEAIKIPVDYHSPGEIRSTGVNVRSFGPDTADPG